MSIDAIRQQLGARYRIDRELGRGGMGAVYLALDLRLDRPVALKVLPAEFASQAGLRERFVRETRTAASFSHPNIVPVYSIEEGPDFLAYAMAFVEGESLAERVRRAPLTIRETVKLLHDTGYALAYAHGRGVVHRDIKPDNIMIERGTGRAMVMDFGISRSISAPPAGSAQGLTRVGEVVGTPEYMSPEQATGDHVDGRSDLYALGLTAYFALTGRPAFTGDTTGKVLARQITERLTPIAELRTDVPSALAEAIDRCVEKDPAARFGTAEELVEALDAAKLSGPEIPLALRMLQQEQASLSMVVVFTATIMYLLIALIEATDSSIGEDAIIPITVVFAVLLTRVMQTMREVRRLVADGYSRTAVHAGLTAVVTERDQRRDELRTNASVRRARTRTLWSIPFLLAGATATTWGAFQYRFPTETGGHAIALPGLVLITTALMLFGIALALTLRSPFRRPLGERLYRLVWLGLPGRAFLWISSRGAANEARPRMSAPMRAPAPPPPARGVVAPDRVEALERRIRDLEAWRERSGPA